MPHNPYTQEKLDKKQLWKIIVAIFATGEGSGLALMSLNTNSEWFKTLTLSPIHPPYPMFDFIWVTLYILMGCSFVIALLHPNITKSIHICYIINIFLAALWSPAFFLLKSPIAGLIVAIATIINSIILCAKVIKISKEAAYMLIPYVIWLGFAIYLNATIVALN